MSELEVLILMLVLLSPMFFGVGFFVGCKKSRTDERAKVIDELLDLDCKRDVTQDECDAYVSTSGCGQCKLNRILKKAEQIKE